jgi:hypothetical protein
MRTRFAVRYQSLISQWFGTAGATNSSCPGLSRLRGRSRFGEAKARASTFFVPWERSWMAGTSPAMTMWGHRA